MTNGKRIQVALFYSNSFRQGKKVKDFYNLQVSLGQVLEGMCKIVEDHFFHLCNFKGMPQRFLAGRHGSAVPSSSPPPKNNII